MENKKYDEFIKDSYREYSIEVLQNRALSDYRDGLKPVQRKALWTAYKLGLHNNKAFTKSSNVTGNLMARFHAHADAYQVLVNMSQGSLNTPLFEGQGNWGNYIDPPAAARYCFVGDTRIMTSEGLIKIGSLDNGVNKKVETDFYVNSFEQAEKSAYWLNSGFHRTMTLDFKDGSHISCTPNQPFLVFQPTLCSFAWKKAENLYTTDLICQVRNSFVDVSEIKSGKKLPDYVCTVAKNARGKVNNIKKFPKRMSVELATILGCLVSEGHISRYSIEFCNSDVKFVKLFKDCIKKVFGEECWSRYNKADSHRGWTKKRYWAVGVNGVKLADWLKNVVGLGDELSYYKRVPEIIFTSSKKEVAAFLRALYEGDGSAFKLGSSYCSSSPKLLEDVQLLLFNYFGVHSIIQKDKLVVSGAQNGYKFWKNIGFISNRKNACKKESISVNLNEDWKCGKLDEYVPKEVFNRFIKLCKQNYALKIFIDTFTRNKSYKHYTKFCSIIRALYPLLNDEKLLTFANRFENYRFTSITNMHYDDVNQVYDLNVPNGHAFTAGMGILSHNTEVKLSKYSDDFLLNDNYLNVTKMIPNYLDTEVEPLLLPSLLPTLLLIGCQGIAVGYKTEIPCFTLKSVVKLTKLALQRKVSAKDLLKVLEFDDVYNAICVAEDNQLLDYYKSGKGSIPFSVDWDVEEGKKSFIIYSIVGNGETMISKIESDDRVYQVNDLTSGNDIQIQVVLKPSVKLDEVEDIADDIVDNLTVNKIFVTNVIESSVIETKDGGVTFYENTAKLKETNLVDLINEWIEWRIDLETRMLKDQIRIQEEYIKKLEFYRWVISKLDIIFKVLKSKCKDLTEELSKKLKCSTEEARQILDMPVRRLSKLSDEELKQNIKQAKDKIILFKKWLKKPADKIIEDISSIKVDNYTQA